jgi:DNA-binding NarL/FixJ family response regulator
MGLRHVAVLNEEYVLTQTVEEIIATAEGQSTMAATEREGIVFKQVDGGMTFKAISNKYLLNEK